MVADAVEEPAAKRPKTEGEPQEKEQDAPADTREKLQTSITFPAQYSTLNVIETTGGRILTSLSGTAAQYLVAGARANVAASTGRYFYEVRILETLASDQQQRKGTAAPRQLVRLGFSTAGSSLVLGEDAGAVCFDAEGFFLADGKRTDSCQRFSKDQILAVLLNLDKTSANAGTISLFRNGERISEPLPLPQGLQEKPLFPHVAYRNVTLQINFGPRPIRSLPFKCCMLQDAAEQDVTIMKPLVTKDGKCEVIFPVGLPDELTFDWLDGFLKAHPDYAELSDRKILEWAAASGVYTKKNQSSKSSTDKPDFNFGIYHMDDFSVRRVLQSLAPLVSRNYVLMEVKQNLLESDRRLNLKKFLGTQFKKVAHVTIGEPSDSYKETVRSAILEQKRKEAEELWKAEKLEKEEKRMAEQREKQKLKEMAVAEPLPIAQSKSAPSFPPPQINVPAVPPPPLNPGKGACLADGTNVVESMEAEKKIEEEDLPPEVQLNDEEKKLWFKPPGVPDLQPNVLIANFAQFSLPIKEEGFDEVRFEWQDAGKAQQHLERWLLKMKRSLRVEDLVPSEWLKTQINDFQKHMIDWQEKQTEAVSNGIKSRSDTDDIEAMGDLLPVEDVCNVGGKPLFLNFEPEDWALVILRFELNTLLQAFRRDVADEEWEVSDMHMMFYYNRYYGKELNPQLFGKENLRELLEIVTDTVCHDVETGTCFSSLPQSIGADGRAFDVSAYVKLAEERRRERQRRLDAGDDSVKLSFMMRDLQQAQFLQTAPPAPLTETRTPAPPPPPPAPAAGYMPPPDAYKGYGGDKGYGYKGDGYKGDGYKSYGYKGDKGCKGKGYGKGKYY